MSSEKKELRVGISIGDLNGIGIEVIIKTLSDIRVFQNCTPIIYGSTKSFSFYRKMIHSPDFNFNTIRTVEGAIPRKVNVLNCWGEEEVKIEPGTPTDISARHAFRSFETAVSDIQSSKIDVLVTGPVNKYAVQQTGVSFKGHTEYLAEKFSAKDFLMLLVSDSLRVGVVTGHVPLQQVASLLSIDIIMQKARSMHLSLKKDFGFDRPKIAILGLNPHAGDNGLIGNEEKEIIAPAIKKLTDENILAYGPYSADGLFGSPAFTRFDGILAMYHDQGLVPFKSIAFTSGVNFTAGLPIIRTSPDHGPAFDIAGKNLASESSFREAFYMAQDIYHRRAEYREISANPLPLGFSRLSGDQ